MEGKPLYTYEDYLKSFGVTSDWGLKRSEKIQKYFHENPKLFEKLKKEYQNKHSQSK